MERQERQVKKFRGVKRVDPRQEVAPSNLPSLICVKRKAEKDPKELFLEFDSIGNFKRQATDADVVTEKLAGLKF